MTVRHFYDPLTPFYHIIYGDWNESIRVQGSQVDSVIREVWGDRINRILDAVCGIGTQAIGLAQLGYRVAASDISPGPLERAKKEAAARKVEIESFTVADFRTLSASHPATFDLVIACDNAIPHLLCSRCGNTPAGFTIFPCTLWKIRGVPPVRHT